MGSTFFEEVEVLKSIYLDDVIISESGVVEYKEAGNILKISISTSYPEQVPQIFVKGISEIQGELEAFSKRLLGVPMIYDIIEEFKRLSHEKASSIIQEDSKVETIDSRSFHNETPFSKELFLKWAADSQEFFCKEVIESSGKETGKTLFSRLKGHSDYDSLINEAQE